MLLIITIAALAAGVLAGLGVRQILRDPYSEGLQSCYLWVLALIIFIAAVAVVSIASTLSRGLL